MKVCAGPAFHLSLLLTTRSFSPYIPLLGCTLHRGGVGTGRGLHPSSCQMGERPHTMCLHACHCSGAVLETQAQPPSVVVCSAPAHIPNECPVFQAERHLPLTGPERCAGDNTRHRAFQLTDFNCDVVSNLKRGFIIKQASFIIEGLQKAELKHAKKKTKSKPSIMTVQRQSC